MKYSLKYLLMRNASVYGLSISSGGTNINRQRRFLIISYTFLLCNFQNLYAAASSPSTQYFTDADISKIRHFTKHSYLVAQQFHEWGRVEAALEAQRVPVAGEEVYTFRGTTGIPGHYHDQALGSIYRPQDGNNIYISFHGSHFLSDWLTDFNALRTPATKHGFEGNLHRGFSRCVLSSYRSMVHQIRRIIGETPINDITLTFCGHSLGGALATIAARQFSASNGGVNAEAPLLPAEAPLLPPDFDRTKIKLVTFSSPPVGDAVFASQYETDVPVVLRFHHSADIVPGVERIRDTHVGYPIKFLSLETTSSLLGTAPGLATLRDTLGGISRPNIVGRAAHAIADGALVVPVVGAAPYIPLKIGAYIVDGTTRLVPPIIQLMHLVPEEDVVLKAFNFERVRDMDEDYKGLSWWEYTRNPILSWLYKWL